MLLCVHVCVHLCSCMCACAFILACIRPYVLVCACVCMCLPVCACVHVIPLPRQYTYSIHRPISVTADTSVIKVETSSSTNNTQLHIQTYLSLSGALDQCTIVIYIVICMLVQCFQLAVKPELHFAKHFITIILM